MLHLNVLNDCIGLISIRPMFPDMLMSPYQTTGNHSYVGYLTVLGPRCLLGLWFFARIYHISSTQCTLCVLATAWHCIWLVIISSTLFYAGCFNNPATCCSLAVSHRHVVSLVLIIIFQTATAAPKVHCLVPSTPCRF